MSLSAERCEVCQPGMPTLSEAAVAEVMLLLHADWSVDADNRKIRRRIATSDFGESMSLAVRIGFIAEAEGHHPDLHVHWGRVVVDITTHAAKGLTRNDFILAAKIDALLT